MSAAPAAATAATSPVNSQARGLQIADLGDDSDADHRHRKGDIRDDEEGRADLGPLVGGRRSDDADEAGPEAEALTEASDQAADDEQRERGGREADRKEPMPAISVRNP